MLKRKLFFKNHITTLESYFTSVSCTTKKYRGYSKKKKEGMKVSDNVFTLQSPDGQIRSSSSFPLGEKGCPKTEKDAHMKQRRRIVFLEKTQSR